MRNPEPITAAEIRKKVTPICGTCGSDEVRIEAWAEWNDVKQNWVIQDALHDNMVCADCGKDTQIKWRLEK